MKVLILDNRDSFVHNISTLLEDIPDCACHIVKGDELCIRALELCDALILSPGPGIPSEHPGLIRAIEWSRKHHLPTLGICLGMQALAEAFGAKLTQLQHPYHGHASKLKDIDPSDPLFRGIDEETVIGRYHSWVVDQASLPPALLATAFDSDSLLMAIRHNELPLYGMQFHPESIITEHGRRMLTNFLGTIR